MRIDEAVRIVMSIFFIWVFLAGIGLNLLMYQALSNELPSGMVQWLIVPVMVMVTLALPFIGIFGLIYKWRSE